MRLTPTESEFEQLIQVSMDVLRKESGGDFDEYATAFFKTGFKCGFFAALERVVLREASTEKGREN